MPKQHCMVRERLNPLPPLGLIVQFRPTDHFDGRAIEALELEVARKRAPTGVSPNSRKRFLPVFVNDEGRRRLSGALHGLIGDEDAASPERLLEDGEGLHAITAIKRQPRDFSHKQLLAEIERGEQMRARFELSLRR